MTDTMKSILERVLSQEIAHQENWQADDAERFGEDVMNRGRIIQEVKEFMEQNDIKFREDFYLQEIRYSTYKNSQNK